jgi:parallel beta-helix repeat protein
MRTFLFLIFILPILTANATTYYFAVSGNDSNAGTIASPWQSISKFNAVFSLGSPGDNFLFNRGDTFYGKIVISRSGSSGLPITIGAYGRGANPIITGFTKVSAWTNLGANIWESTGAVSTLPTCNMVVINGVNTAMGRTPNYPNYYTWNSHTGNTSISTDLSGTTNWTGAELAIFTTSYINARHPITSQSGGTIYFTSSGDLWQNAPEFFFQQFHIQNDIRTLDTLNEWYYNPSTKKLDVYNTVMPTGVQAATVDTLIYTNNQSHITIRDLALTGANKDAISIPNSSYIKVINCNISYVGGTAIYGNCGVIEPGLRIDSNTINQVNNSGIDLKLRFMPDTIRYNTVKNINMLIGMQTVDHTIFRQVVGLGNESDNGITSYNNVDSVGNIGIYYLGSNAIVDHNLVTNTCIGNAIRDGGAIYTWNGSNRPITGTMKVFNNIVLNTGSHSEGIYCDENSNNIEIYNNTSFNVLRGIYLNDSHEINVHDNTTFNTGAAGLGAGLFMNNNTGAPKLRNITLKNNKFIAKTTIDRSLWVITADSASIPKPFTSDDNYFAKPLSDATNNIQTYMVGASYVQRTLASWQTLNGQDFHSKQSPKVITDVNDFNFQYNATSSPITISLPYNYIDITGAIYNGSVTIPAYSSWVGIKNSDR